MNQGWDDEGDHGWARPGVPLPLRHEPKHKRLRLNTFFGAARVAWFATWPLLFVALLHVRAQGEYAKATRGMTSKSRVPQMDAAWGWMKLAIAAFVVTGILFLIAAVRQSSKDFDQQSRR